MTHSLVAFNMVSQQIVVRPVASFAGPFDPAFEGNGWVQALCLAGGEAEAINAAVEHHLNPPIGMDDEYEPEYSLAGGWAAYDAR